MRTRLRNSDRRKVRIIGKGSASPVVSTIGFAAFEHPKYAVDQVVVDRATDAAVAKLHDTFAGRDDQFAVNSDLADFVHDDGDLEPVLARQDMIQQRRFPAAKEAGDDGHRQAEGARRLFASEQRRHRAWASDAAKV